MSLRPAAHPAQSLLLRVTDALLPWAVAGFLGLLIIDFARDGAFNAGFLAPMIVGSGRLVYRLFQRRDHEIVTEQDELEFEERLDNKWDFRTKRQILSDREAR